LKKKKLIKILKKNIFEDFSIKIKVNFIIANNFLKKKKNFYKNLLIYFFLNLYKIFDIFGYLNFGKIFYVLNNNKYF
jgi:hypothetical protein